MSARMKSSGCPAALDEGGALALDTSVRPARCRTCRWRMPGIGRFRRPRVKRPHAVTSCCCGAPPRRRSAASRFQSASPGRLTLAYADGLAMVYVEREDVHLNRSSVVPDVFTPCASTRATGGNSWHANQCTARTHVVVAHGRFGPHRAEVSVWIRSLSANLLISAKMRSRH